MKPAAVASSISLLLLLSACGGESDGNPGPPVTPRTSSTTTATATDPEDGELRLASGLSVRYRCAGLGEPGILLEAGTEAGGLESFGYQIVEPLAAVTRVCTYDRPGTGLSDAAPKRKRKIDDLCDVEDEVRRTLRLKAPSVLVGHSGGANLVIWCASRRPAAVAALVSIEGYHDDPASMAEEGFDWRENVEHTDYVEGAEKLDAMSMPIGTFPVLVISATDADPGAAHNQRYWLALSARSRQVVLEGGHDLPGEVPNRVVAEILRNLPSH